MQRWAAMVLMLLLPNFAFGAERIVSLNHCADQFLLYLGVKPISLTFMAADPGLSLHAHHIKDVPLNHGRAEEILPLKPDLVVGGTYGASFALSRLQDLGTKVLRVPPITSIHEMRQALIDLGGELEIDVGPSLARIDGLRAAEAVSRPTVLIIEARGQVSGSGSLRHELAELAGLENLAARHGIGAYGALSLEQILAMKPDILIHVPYAPERPALAETLFNHPAFDPWREKGLILTLPTRRFNCGTPNALSVVADMEAVADHWRALQ